MTKASPFSPGLPTPIRDIVLFTRCVFNVSRDLTHLHIDKEINKQKSMGQLLFTATCLLFCVTKWYHVNASGCVRFLDLSTGKVDISLVFSNASSPPTRCGESTLSSNGKFQHAPPVTCMCRPCQIPLDSVYADCFFATISK